MATGDIDDMGARLQALVPSNWFTAGLAPLRDAALRGAASVLAFIFALLLYVRAQTRIATATDGFLDMIAADFFGTRLPRAENQSDTSYRARIIANLFRERGTRASVVQVLTQLTGREPLIFEPRRPADTGAYGAACGYGLAGGYGSMVLPRQAFVTAYRPLGTGVPNIAGYGISTTGYSTPSQGEYASLDMVRNAVTDADIYAAIDSVRPIGTTIWARIAT